MYRIITIFIFSLLISGLFASTDSTSVLAPDSVNKTVTILTPGYENIILAKINGVEIREFDVFGIPSISKTRDKMTKSKRNGKIQDYILDTIFQTEGNIAEIKNSQSYKKTYNTISKKISVDQYRDDIITEEFLSEDKVKQYYESNKDKYPSGFEQIDRIKEDLIKTKKKDIGLHIKKILDSLKKYHNVKYDEELFTKISHIKIADPVEFADSLMRMGSKTVLVSYGKQISTVGILAKVVKDMKPYHMANLKKVSVLKSLVEGKILNELLATIADSKGYLKDSRVVSNSNDKMKYFISSEYKKRIFSPDNLKPTKEELIDYYIEHKDDAELKTKKKMWTYEIFKFYDNKDSIESNDKIKVALELENIRQKILEGESFEKYAKFYSRPNTRDGELGYIYKTDHAMVGKTADQLKVNDVSELIIQEKAISIVKVTEIKEPQLYKFNYVEEIVENRVIDQKRDKLKFELKRKLFEKYKVELINAQ